MEHFPNLLDHGMLTFSSNPTNTVPQIMRSYQRACRAAQLSNSLVTGKRQGLWDKMALKADHICCVVPAGQTHQKWHQAQVCSQTASPLICCCPQPRRHSPEAPWHWNAGARGSHLRFSPDSSGLPYTRLLPGPAWPEGHPLSSSVADWEDGGPGKPKWLCTSPLREGLQMTTTELSRTPKT